MAYASGFRDQYARARPMTAARRRTWGRLAAWAGLDLGDDIAGEVLRCPAPCAERVDGREHSFLLQTRHYQGLQRDQAAAGAGVFVTCLSRHSSLRRFRSHRLAAAVSGGTCSRYGA